MAAGLKLSQLDVLTLSSGTLAPLTSNTLYSYSLLLTAEASNTGSVYIGDSSVTINTGIPIEPGNTLTLSSDNQDRFTELDASDIYAVTSTTGNKVRIAIMRRRV